MGCFLSGAPTAPNILARGLPLTTPKAVGLEAEAEPRGIHPGPWAQTDPGPDHRAGLLSSVGHRPVQESTYRSGTGRPAA